MNLQSEYLTHIGSFHASSWSKTDSGEEFNAASQNSNDRSNLLSFSFKQANLYLIFWSNVRRNTTTCSIFICTISISSLFSQSF